MGAHGGKFDYTNTKFDFVVSARSNVFCLRKTKFLVLKTNMDDKNLAEMLFPPAKSAKPQLALSHCQTRCHLFTTECIYFFNTQDLIKEYKSSTSPYPDRDDSNRSRSDRNKFLVGLKSLLMNARRFRSQSCGYFPKSDDCAKVRKRVETVSREGP